MKSSNPKLINLNGIILFPDASRQAVRQKLCRKFLSDLLAGRKVPLYDGSTCLWQMITTTKLIIAFHHRPITLGCHTREIQWFKSSDLDHHIAVFRLPNASIKAKNFT